MPAKIPTDELVTNLQDVAADLNKTPTQAEYINHELGKFSTNTYERRFNKWNRAAREAGLEPNKRHDIPTDELLTNLQDVATGLGKTPTQAEYRNHDQSKFSVGTFEEKFNKWNRAAREAGLEPNKRHNIPTDELLTNIRDVATDLSKTPTQAEYTEHELSEFSTYPFKTEFNSWWTCVVTAGCRPFNRRPLQPSTLDQYYQTAANLPPKKALPPLLFLFTGLPETISQHLTSEWLQEKRDRNIVRVPPQHTKSGEPWLFRIPDEWQNPHTGETEPTHLPQILEWVLNDCGEIPRNKHGLINQCRKVAQASGISSDRECTHHRINESETPVVRPSDLWATHGINLARRGIDPSIIKRRLGIGQIKRKRDLKPKDFMIWVYVHEGYEHPELDPPEIVLDPV